MYSSVEAFLRELEELKQEMFPDARLQMVYSRFNRSSLRMHIDASCYIDMYCNVENGRFDFSLIQSGRRIFGYDNLTEWHYHPVHDPASHIRCDEPTMRKIFKEITSVIHNLLKEIEK